MYRASVAVAVVLLWMAFGPWLPLLALVPVALPRVRDRVRPLRPWRDLAVGTAVVALLAAMVVVVPDGWLPIPQGPGRLVTPAYVGRPAITRPVTGPELPRHPHLADDGRGSAHNDAWATGAYAGPGPAGEQPEVDTAWFGLERCGTLTFDRSGRVIGLCSGLGGPALRILDPGTMRPLATRALPDPAGAGEEAPSADCDGSAFYLDERDRAVLATADHRVVAFATSDADGEPDLTLDETFDLGAAVAEDDCLVALVPDWDGRIWFGTRTGVVGAVDPGTGVVRSLDLQEEIVSTFSVDETGVHAVTGQGLYRLEAGAAGRPTVVWRAQYDRGREVKPGQLDQGSGTPPTLLPGGLVAIADNASPRMNVVFLRRDTGQEVCAAPVFDEDASATRSSLVAVGDGVVVVNNHGYRGPLSTALGFGTAPGLARVDVADGDCEVAWTSGLNAPSSAPKASLETGLLYAYTKRSTLWGASAWYLSALDLHTGRHVFSVRTGTGVLMDSHRATVALAPDGSAYVATVAGMVRVRDRD